MAAPNRPHLAFLVLLAACTSDTTADPQQPEASSDTGPEDTAPEDTGKDTVEDTGEAPEEDPPPVYDCGDEALYSQDPIGQWRVCVSADLQASDASLCEEAMALLESDLGRIEGLWEDAIIEQLQSVRIWLERDVAAFPGGVYHPSASWLSSNGYPEYWAEGIQLGNAANYLSWTSIQPALVLHELSHAWHHQVLGYDQSEIKAAYDAAMASGIYEAVAYAGGGTQEAYATTNEIEYFAELSEAYFWENDFYPFTQSELAEFDPQGFTAVENAWLPLD